MSEKSTLSLFDLFGPVMIGPSSSHTAGVCRIAYLARLIFHEPIEKATIRFYGSLAYTYKGHGSDLAVVAGLLGIRPEDERLAHSMELAEEQGAIFTIEPIYEKHEEFHQNTLIVELEGAGKKMSLRGASIGGGNIEIQEIDRFEVSLTGHSDALLVQHRDQVGVIAIVSHIMAANQLNIARTASHRKRRGEDALLVLEVDMRIKEKLIEQIEDLPAVDRVVYIPKLF